jgi:hypothetical protein
LARWAGGGDLRIDLSEYAKQIPKNYVVSVRDGRIVDLVEKPSAVSTR